MNDQQADMKKIWNVHVTIVNKVLFIVDTGAEVTAMSDSAWESLQNITGKVNSNFVVQIISQ